MTHVRKSRLEGVTKVMKYLGQLPPESLTSLYGVTGLSSDMSAQDKMVPGCCLCPQLLICQNHCFTEIWIVLWVSWACPEARAAHLLPCKLRRATTPLPSQELALGAVCPSSPSRYFCLCLFCYYIGAVSCVDYAHFVRGQLEGDWFFSTIM